MDAERTLENPPQTPPELWEYRAMIDNVDAALVHLLAGRFRCTQKADQLKARLDLPPSNPARKVQQVERLQALAEESSLGPEFAKEFLRFVVGEVIRRHVAWRDFGPVSPDS